MERQYRWTDVMRELKLFFAQREMREYRRRRKTVVPVVMYGDYTVHFD